jgi:ABC-type Na+ transport system ATPase subunit NatA
MQIKRLCYNHKRMAPVFISRIQKTGTPVAGDLSPEALVGEIIAPAEPTGAGKPTIVNLIRRFHEFDAGRITVCNVDRIRVFNDGQIVGQRVCSQLLEQRGVCDPLSARHNQGHQT